MHASTWQLAPTDIASSAIAGMSSCTPCGYCGADPTTSTVFGPSSVCIASTSAVQSARTGALRTMRPKLCAALWNAACADSASTISGSVMPRSARARSRAARTPHRIDSVPPLVRNPATSSSPWSRLAVHPTVSDWIRRSDGKAWVLSAFSCRYIAAAASATAWTDGPPSYTSPNVRPSRQRTSSERRAASSSITSSTGRPLLESASIASSVAAGREA